MELAFGYDRQLADTLDVELPTSVVAQVYVKIRETLTDVPLSTYRAMDPEAIVGYVREVSTAWLERYL